MSEKTVKINLLHQCPDNCAAMEIEAEKTYVDDALFSINHYCKNVDICARVFESMENQQNGRDHM